MNGALPATNQVLTPDEIIDLQMRGMAQQAHDAYVAYFHANEIDFALLSLFGVCCRQLGKDEKAENLFRHIIQEAPSVTEAHAHLAEILIDRGDKAEALAILEADIVHETGDLVLRTTRGKLHADLQNWQSAADDLTFVHRARPEDVSIILALVEIERLLQHQDRVDELLALAIFHQPANVEVLLAQAETFMERENYEAAIGNYTRITDARPHHLEAGIQKCKALEKIEAFTQLTEEAERLVALEPDNGQILKLLLATYRRVKNHTAAIQVGSHLERLSLGDAMVSHSVASAYFGLGKVHTALAILEKIEATSGRDPLRLMDRAVCLERLFRFDEAIDVYDEAIALKPAISRLIRYNKSHCLLALGEFKAGFELYEDRFFHGAFKLRQYVGTEPEWDGIQDISGKHILFHPEQGFGDTIMAVRFLKQFDKADFKCTLAIQRPLLDIIETLEVDCDLIPVGAQIDKVDFHCSLMSLARITSHQWDELPAYHSYLHVPKAAQKRWAPHFGASDKPRIGFVCSGNPEHKNDLHRSMPMALLLDCLPEGAEYHCLQKDLRATDKAAIAARPDIICHDHEIASFADTAAICKQMDLVISVDTSVAHLAGALGCNLLVMVPFCGDWRWGVDPVRSTWYPTANVVRQQTLDDWSHVLNTISLRIESLIAAR